MAQAHKTGIHACSQAQAPDKIIGIQFSMMTADEIRKTSVAEITSRDTYVNNRPVIGGLFDPRMGVLEPGLICPTDGLNYMQTPGYFGHIELARPVFYIQYLNQLMKTLRCVCFRCSKLLISKEDHKHILTKSAKERWDYVFSNASAVSRCGDENMDGCRCVQPKKIYKEGLANLYAKWEPSKVYKSHGEADEQSEPVFAEKDETDEYLEKIADSAEPDTKGVRITPEIAIQILERITDDDAYFMGYSPVFSRPESMVCQVLAVPPPSVRPSVKHDAQQRSEDDLTHILVNIVKANRTLQEKMNQVDDEGQGVDPKLIDDWTMVLQYFVATMVNNKLPGVAAVTQRSGRSLKSIIDRLNGKHGRVRGNLMGKRVDFSARSVITPDANISIRQIGVPMKIAMNLTQPIVVNARNRAFLNQLVIHGPDVYPGAKILEKKNGDNISLRHVDRESLVLDDGDIVHRHMMNGDMVLFNRQPTLHRMSMMGHEVKVMKEGNTFRMNVADTKPYNADFDGDEMNLHAPQDEEASSELRNLAYVPRQIISPANNSSIVGIFQDSLLGAYRLTRENVVFSPRQAMNLLMCYPGVRDALFGDPERPLTSFDVISQILPAMSSYFTNGQFDSSEDMRTSNNVIDIKNGRYMRGQMDKGTLGSGSKGLIHRIFNDFGYEASADFIDHLQGIVTEYMKQSGYSVGISDLIADSGTNSKIAEAITKQKQEAMNIIQELHVGVFENNTGKTNYEEFETRMNTILNKAREEGGKIGRKSLSKDNRFVIMVNAGSKGNNLNIVQMISCLGQQNVDGKRIPYGLEGRTLPHFTKYDDSPEARGFVENSFVQGLSPQELFFHAMGGREGLIDTAVKSVAWDTPVILSESGSVKYTKIGEWIDGLLESNRDQVEQHDASQMNMELLTLSPSTVFIPTTDAQGHVSWSEMTAVNRHDPGQVLYKIETMSGRSVIVTASKSLIVWDKNTHTFEEKACTEITTEDYLPSTSYLPSPLDPSNEADSDSDSDSCTPFHMETVDDVDQLEWAHVFASMEFITSIVNELEAYHVFPCTQETRDKLVNLYARVNQPCSWSMDKNGTYWVTRSTQSTQHNNVILDKITTITPVSPDEHPKMYDVTVPKTLNFMLANGLQVRDTSSTGYIQRRLIKGMEDMKVTYDMTVRNNKNKIVQFAYGDDNMDSTKVETQTLPLAHMSYDQLYAHFMIPEGTREGRELLNKVFVADVIPQIQQEREEYTKLMEDLIREMMVVRDVMLTNVFENRENKKVYYPVNLQAILRNVGNQLMLSSSSQANVSFLEAYRMIEREYAYLESLPYNKPTALFKALYYYYLNPKELLVIHRFHRDGIEALLLHLRTTYLRSVVHPGEMVGLVAAQSIGEPTTQLTLNSFTYETPVIVRNKKGQCKSVQMGEFVDRLCEAGASGKTKMEYYKDKDTTYAPVPEDESWEIQAPDEDGNVAWYPIEAGTKHPVINEDGTNTMLRVTTMDEHEIVATKAKSFLILQDGKLRPTRGDEVTVDDYIPISVKQIDHVDKEELHVIDILSPTEYMFGSHAYKAMKVWNEPQWWAKHQTKLFTVPYTRSDSFKRRMNENSNNVVIQNGFVYPKKTWKHGAGIPEHIQLDYDFGYLIGAYCAEGCMTRTQISIANNDTNYITPIKRWCDKYGITTKYYVHENKNKESWVSSDIRIYNIVLRNILFKLCGKLSHNKYIHETIIFSNKECKRGFLNGYYGGDGTIDIRTKSIIACSTSYKLLNDLNVMNKTLGIMSYIRKNKRSMCNNRNTSEENIRQTWSIHVRNTSVVKLASLLSTNEITSKSEKSKKLTQYNPKTSYLKHQEQIPNKINGAIRFEERNQNMNDVVFVKIKSIEEVPNTTAYAYDLTVAEVRNFIAENGMALRDTFHFSGISSKSGVTRGVPRIEEILSLSENPKNPSMTVFLHEDEQEEQGRVMELMHRLEHTSLRDVTESVSIYFDPDDENTRIEDDRLLLEQFKQFRSMVQECMESEDATVESKTRASRWVVRFKIDREELLERNITMDDIYLAIQTSYKDDIACVFSDMNADNLILRVRTMEKISKTKQAPLDQMDEIYRLKSIQDNMLDNIVLRGVRGISKVTIRKIPNYMVRQKDIYTATDVWVLDTMGTNLMDMLANPMIDTRRTVTNDLMEIYRTLGIEAVRQAISMEFADVLGGYINYHHMSMLCDRMTMNYKPTAISRHGTNNDDIGPLAKASFEETPKMFLEASIHAELDPMTGVSANVMCGQEADFGTSIFDLVVDTQILMKQQSEQLQQEESLDSLFVMDDPDDPCATENIKVLNHASLISGKNLGKVDEEYDAGF